MYGEKGPGNEREGRRDKAPKDMVDLIRISIHDGRC